MLIVSGERFGELESAVLAVWPGCLEGGHDLAGDDAGLVGELVDDLEPLASPLGGVDDDGEDRYPPLKLPQGVAVGFVVSVVAPDSPQAGSAGCARLAQAADQLVV